MPNDVKPKQTLVEEGTELTGTLRSTCPVVVNGTIDGEFVAPELTVTSAGAVLGTIQVEKLQSDGTLSGNIDAKDVYLAGTVKPSTVIKARTMEVKLGAESGKKLEVMFGECALEVGDEPEAAQAISEAPVSRKSTPPPGITYASSNGGGLWGDSSNDAATNGKTPSIAPEA
jgi:cytoskeletal protein CcmA (bactofilin family)